MLLIYLFSVVLHISFVLSADLTVETTYGNIEGYLRTSPHHVTFRAFQGIPYAKPPLGNLRFQAPVPPDSWSGVIETKIDGSRCYSVAKDTPDEDENCLFINVYTPILTKSNATLLPVMFYLFGGGFRDGASQYNVYGPDYLIEQEVLMVSLNYRVGPFGFLSTADTVIPGNAGLKDQVLGLKWVQQNIKSFGGDPDKVTIFGQSAGGASVGLHYMSQSSAGLFRGGIGESGSGVSNWAYIADPKPYGYELASLINSTINIDSSSALLSFLQSVPAKQIDIASTKTTKIDHPLPVIEVEHAGAFLTKNMYQALKSGDFNRVPLFIGANSEEYISLATDMDSLRKRAASYDKSLKNLVPHTMNIVNKQKLDELGHKIKEIYMSANETFKDNLGLAIAYNSESHFLNPCVRHAEIQSQYTDVYFYKFSYAGLMGRNTNITLPGTEKDTHGEELFYIFKRALNGYDNSDLSRFSNDDVLTHKRMIKLWTNFAKYLNPTPESDPLLQNMTWPKMEPDQLNYVNIDTDLEIENNIKHGRYIKWRDLFEENAIDPVMF
ncbi:hypothetical protein C4B38_000111 [Diabrotica virgifera virgifera]|uniref:Carboxylic ester hydrolase n=1 Tax=Diabrotica virgifera virgifera TaxID=50390 RepID=A0A6P7FFJ8_DIAVI|nr:hypothetical protein C4B38_000111 [Diabrotica virgifera virgifera]